MISEKGKRKSKGRKSGQVAACDLLFEHLYSREYVDLHMYMAYMYRGYMYMYV